MNRLQQKYISGCARYALEIRIAVVIVARYTMRFARREITLRQLISFLKRIFLLSGVLRYNKAVCINATYKLHLYLPAFPTKAFYTAIDKFLTVQGDAAPMSVLLSMTKACGYACLCHKQR